MPDYRAYIVGRDGHFIGAHFLRDHPDDATAIEAAKQMVDGFDVEIWDRDRFVVRLKATPK
jgi:hypothetical protein